jgi:hypothetical protein
MERRYPNRRWDLALLASAAFHAMLGTGLLLIPPNQAQHPPGSSSSIAVVVPPADASSADHHLADSSEAPVAMDRSEDADRTAGLDVDVEKLRERSEALFPFLTTGLDFLNRISEQVHGATSRITPPLAREPQTSHRLPPLELSSAALQQTIDRAWSRRSRWTAFAEIAELVRTHDADNGVVPSVLAAYLDQNLLQLFCDTGTRVPRLWAMLENAADHIDFIEFVGEFSHDRPSSLATTELLFLLDKLAQASRDALLLLLSIEPESELTSSGRDDGFELAGALQRHYRERLEQRQLSSSDDIRGWYDMVRLRILSTIMATSPHGYRAADARFLAGAIQFEQGDRAEATRWWRDIQPDSRDRYVEEYSRLLDELQWPSGIRPRQIEYILDSVSSRWRASALKRLRHFGSTCESY